MGWSKGANSGTSQDTTCPATPQPAGNGATGVSPAGKAFTTVASETLSVPALLTVRWKIASPPTATGPDPSVRSMVRPRSTWPRAEAVAGPPATTTTARRTTDAPQPPHRQDGTPPPGRGRRSPVGRPAPVRWRGERHRTARHRRDHRQQPAVRRVQGDVRPRRARRARRAGARLPRRRGLLRGGGARARRRGRVRRPGLRPAARRDRRRRTRRAGARHPLPGRQPGVVRLDLLVVGQRPRRARGAASRPSHATSPARTSATSSRRCPTCPSPTARSAWSCAPTCSSPTPTTSTTPPTRPRCASWCGWRGRRCGVYPLMDTAYVRHPAIDDLRRRSRPRAATARCAGWTTSSSAARPRCSSSTRVSIPGVAVCRRGDHPERRSSDEVHAADPPGRPPTPRDPEAWATLSEDEQKRRLRRTTRRSTRRPASRRAWRCRTPRRPRPCGWRTARRSSPTVPSSTRRRPLGGYLHLRGRRPRRGHRAGRAHPGRPPGRGDRGAPDRGVVAPLERAFRDEWGRVLAALIGFLGDFDLAEEAAQEAFAIAAERWPRDGIPANPGAWLVDDRPQPGASTASAAIARSRRRPACSRRAGGGGGRDGRRRRSPTSGSSWSSRAATRRSPPRPRSR